MNLLDGYRVLNSSGERWQERRRLRYRQSVERVTNGYVLALSEGGELQRIRADLNSVAQQIGSLQALDVAGVQAKLEDFQLIGSRLQALETKIDENDEQDAVEVSNGVHADVT